MYQDYHKNLGMSRFLLHIFSFYMLFVGHIIATSIVIKYKQGHCDDVLKNHGLDFVRFF